MLGQRLITGGLLASAFLAALLWLPAAGLMFLAGVVISLGAWEWGGLTGLRGPGRVGYVLLLAALMLGCVWVGPPWVPLILVVAGVWWLLVLKWVLGYPGSVRRWGSTAMTAVMGVGTLIPAWAAMYWLVNRELGVGWLAAVVMLTVSADIGAFFGGRALGRRRLAPAVSPGKTWAGVGCGLVAALVVSAMLVYPLALVGHWWGWLAVCAVTVGAGILGDLGESMVKRHHGVKDSGGLLPGHGGVLDRIDSLSAALPIFALALVLAERLVGLPV